MHISENIADWDISARSKNCFKNAKIDTFTKLMTISGQRLLHLDNFGKASLKEIKEYISPFVLPKKSDVDFVINDSWGYEYPPHKEFVDVFDMADKLSVDIAYHAVLNGKNSVIFEFNTKAEALSFRFFFVNTMYKKRKGK